MIINNRKDLDAAPDDVRQQFMTRLAGGINRWRWDGDDWEQWQDTTSIRRFGFTLADFPVAPVPAKPDFNPDQRALEQARAAASLTRAQFKIALLENNFLESVKSFVNDPTTDERIKILWEDSSVFERMHPDLIHLAEQLGYTDEQLDAIFGITQENQ